MRYTIASQQFDYFRKEGHITFEALFSQEEAETLLSLLEAARKTNPSGRDLERENPPLLKSLKLSRIGQTASAILHKKPLKLAFTQYYPPYHLIGSLEEISSVTEALGFALIHLSQDPLPDLSYLPTKRGDIAFYEKKFSVDFTDLERPILLVAFSSEKGRYKLQEKDPYTHSLKKLGYGFGDHLTSQTHPIMNR